MQQEKQEGLGFKGSFNIAFGLCHIHQRALTIFLRTG
jgi:hypothetical protein